MSEELLSAMMDGQCTPEEIEQILAALDRSPVLKLRWSRMNAARDALAGTQLRTASPDFALGVMAAVSAESIQDVSANPKVVPMRRVAAEAPVAVSVAPRRARRWQPAVGLAAAASITAAVVLVGGNLLSQPVGVAVAQNQAMVAQGKSIAPASTEVASASADGAEPRETRWTQIDAAAARQLNDYVMEHSNSRSESGMGGSLSYARLAVRTADYRPAEEPR